MRGLEELINITDEHGITTLVDVRTKPYAWCNDFTGRTLSKALGERYEWLGYKLGGLADIDEDAIEELAGQHEGRRLLLMCAEKESTRCYPIFKQ